MKTRLPLVLAAAAAVAVLSSALALSAAGQELRNANARPAIPRTADGKPDLSGIWAVMNTANWNILPHAASADGPGGRGLVIGDELPYLPTALPKVRENYRTRTTADTDVRCLLPGVPRVMYEPYPFEIFQTPDMVRMVFEYVHATRNIYMNSSHPKGPIEWWMGDSRGSWQGDTLVVDAIHFNGDTWFDRAGNYHSPDMHVVERYTLLDRDHLQYEATIEDAKVFSRPWRMRMVLYRHIEEHFQLLEYDCIAFADEAAGNLVPPTVVSR
jgi:hypothetical protein